MRITLKSRQISAVECQYRLMDLSFMHSCNGRRRASPLLPRLPVRVRCRRIDMNFAIDGKSGHCFHRRGIST